METHWQVANANTHSIQVIKNTYLSGGRSVQVGQSKSYLAFDNLIREEKSKNAHVYLSVSRTSWTFSMMESTKRMTDASLLSSKGKKLITSSAPSQTTLSLDLTWLSLHTGAMWIADPTSKRDYRRSGLTLSIRPSAWGLRNKWKGERFQERDDRRMS